MVNVGFELCTSLLTSEISTIAVPIGRNVRIEVVTENLRFWNLGTFQCVPFVNSVHLTSLALSAFKGTRPKWVNVAR
jgi:hypothetical protein